MNPATRQQGLRDWLNYVTETKQDKIINLLNFPKKLQELIQMGPE